VVRVINTSKLEVDFVSCVNVISISYIASCSQYMLVSGLRILPCKTNIYILISSNNQTYIHVSHAIQSTFGDIHYVYDTHFGIARVPRYLVTTQHILTISLCVRLALNVDTLGYVTTTLPNTLPKSWRVV